MKRELPNDIIELWHFRISEVSEASLDDLSSEEKEHAQWFRRPEDQRRSIVSRSRLRHLLGGYLVEVPTILKGEFGKPYLETGDLYFNVAHSGDHLLIGFCRNHEIGVDIEVLSNPPKMFDLMEVICTPREKEQILSLPSEEVEWALTRLWTGKEAYLKGQGTGLQIEPSSFNVPEEVIGMSELERFGCAASIWAPCEVVVQWGFRAELGVSV